MVFRLFIGVNLQIRMVSCPNLDRSSPYLAGLELSGHLPRKASICSSTVTVSQERKAVNQLVKKIFHISRNVLFCSFIKFHKFAYNKSVSGRRMYSSMIHTLHFLSCISTSSQVFLLTCRVSVYTSNV